MFRKIVFFTGFLYLILAFPVGARVIDRIAAVVNDEVITLSELDEACLPLFQKYLRVVTDPIEEEKIVRKIRKQVLERLIEEKLVEQAVKKYHIKVTDEEVEAFIKHIQERMGGEKAFQEFLDSQGLSLREYRETVREQLKKMKLVQGSVQARIVITDEDLRRYYREHYLSEKNRVYVLAAIITGSEEKIKKAAEELKRGEDFSAVARKYSEVPGSGEGLGGFKLDELTPEVRKVIAQMKAGEISSPIQVGSKWQIFKVLAIKEKAAVPFEKVKEKIYQTLFQKELDEYIQQWIKDLKERAFIKVFI